MEIHAKIPLQPKSYFIRAPLITQHQASVEVLASYEKKPTAVRHANTLLTVFHPELEIDFSWHIYFLSQVVKYP